MAVKCSVSYNHVVKEETAQSSKNIILIARLFKKNQCNPAKNVAKADRYARNALESLLLENTFIYLDPRNPLRLLLPVGASFFLLVAVGVVVLSGPVQGVDAVAAVATGVALAAPERFLKEILNRCFMCAKI